MKLKSQLLRHFNEVATTWGCETGWFQADAETGIATLTISKDSNWYIITSPNQNKTVNAQFQLEDFRKTLPSLRGFVEVTISDFSMAIGTVIVPFILGSSITQPVVPGWGESLTIDGHKWNTFLERIHPYTNIEGLQDIFNGFLIDGSREKTVLVATSGNGLFYYNTEKPGNGVRAMIPFKLALSWNTVEEFSITFYHDSVRFSTNGETLIGQILPHTFPDYIQMIEPEGIRTFSFKSEDLMFIKKLKSRIIDVRFHEKDMHMEWMGAWERKDESGERKIPAVCTNTGLKAFLRSVLLPLCDGGEVVTVSTDENNTRFKTNIGGFIYVFSGRNA